MSDIEHQDDPDDGAKLKAILIVCAATAFAVSPFLTEPFAGFDPNHFPNPTPPVPMQPAGYAFSIWGVIYVWLLANALYGLVKRDTDPAWDATRWPLFVSMAIGASWIAVAQMNPLIATLLIFIMMGCSLWALARAPAMDFWWCAAPLGAYAGWLSAASFAALATTLAGWTGLSAMAASWLSLLGLGLLVWRVLQRARPITYPLVLLWALVAVVLATLDRTPVPWLFTGAVILGMGIAVVFDILPRRGQR